MKMRHFILESQRPSENIVITRNVMISDQIQEY